MPAQNIIKEYDEDSYYHIYTRGVDKQVIFKDESDYAVFIGLFKRYLSTTPQKMPNRMPYQNFSTNLQLISYALMPNHVHIFVFQRDMYTIRDFMRAVLTSYSMYFNKKYVRVGPLFQSRYLASRITDEAYFQHITRYIHMNPADWRTSKLTSLDYFIGKRSADWIHPERVIDMTPAEYMKFLASYTENKNTLKMIQWNLANLDS